MHARRVAVTEDIRALDTLRQPDYSSAFEAAITATDSRSPDDRARAMFESAPVPLRRLLWLGWRAVLGFRLGPRRAPGYVQGWRIVGSTPDTVVFEAGSSLMVAHNVLRMRDSRVVLATFVSYRRWPARVLWAVAAPIHHVTIPYLLRRSG
ncbi:MAG TPA: DUF2867 domain-containing protein [Pseudonocardiaceae bacterium]|nr:DUF2867 domain-containing protein [Pseudonocardiaceae bacterium]